ncbi:hypothetical protein DBR42_29710 [Pelomonas sp. HMWF004]|nr:hypothetical protein DBR42_29710 [Pelomonas sp. HMWF004]
MSLLPSRWLRPRQPKRRQHRRASARRARRQPLMQLRPRLLRCRPPHPRLHRCPCSRWLLRRRP